MKTVVRKLCLLGRLGIVAGLLVSGQQAVAQTAAGEVVNNTATVNFSVNSVPQTGVTSNEVTFVVDRRVDFSLTEVDGALTPATPGLAGQFIEFRLQNDSNSALDFDLAQFDLAAGEAVPTGTATGAVMDNVTIEAAEFPASGGDPDPVLGAGRTAVTALAPGDSIRIRVYADTPLTLANLDIAGIRLEATAALGGAPLTETPGADRPDEVDNVFVNGAVGGNAVESDTDGFSVTAAELTATKASVTIEDPISGTTDPKPIPGAFVEYSITLDNAGTEAATSIVLTDTVEVAFVALRDGSYNGGASNVAVGAGFCNADAGDADADNCSYDAGTGALSIAVPDVAGGTNVVVTFQVVVQ